MTVADLIAYLQTVPPETPVVTYEECWGDGFRTPILQHCDAEMHVWVADDRYDHWWGAPMHKGGRHVMAVCIS